MEQFLNPKRAHEHLGYVLVVREEFLEVSAVRRPDRRVPWWYYVGRFVIVLGYFAVVGCTGYLMINAKMKYFQPL